MTDKGTNLRLVLSHHYFDLTLKGKKDVEYREMCPHWRRLIWDRRRSIKTVTFARGYSKTTLTRTVVKIDQGPCPLPFWTDDYYRLHLGPLVKVEVTEDCCLPLQIKGKRKMKIIIMAAFVLLASIVISLAADAPAEEAAPPAAKIIPDKDGKGAVAAVDVLAGPKGIFNYIKGHPKELAVGAGSAAAIWYGLEGYDHYQDKKKERKREKRLRRRAEAMGLAGVIQQIDGHVFIITGDGNKIIIY